MSVNHDYKMQVEPATGNVGITQAKKRNKRSVIRQRFVETMIVADETMYKAFGGNEIELRSYLLSMMAIVSLSCCYITPY